MRYRSRSSSTDQAGPWIPAMTVAHSALPRITKVRVASDAAPPMIWIITTSSSSDATGFATV